LQQTRAPQAHFITFFAAWPQAANARHLNWMRRSGDLEAISR
jgi:hypothetical protein